MKSACIIGWPVEHSRSPMIQSHWLKRYGIDGSYSKVAVKPENVENFLRSLERNGYVGCNVTVPHKEAAFQLADEKDDAAVAVGAANTLWLEGSKLCATNTDTLGYMTYLNTTVPDWASHDAPVCILGAGGAARAIVYGFLSAGVSEIRVFNRSFEKADALAAYFGNRVKAYEWIERNERARDAGVLVNTTTLGMNKTGEPGIDFAAFDSRCVVSDIVYVPLETEFLRKARRRGLRTVDGLGMLLHQAVFGFEKWFGVKPEVDDELYALVAADIEV